MNDSFDRPSPQRWPSLPRLPRQDGPSRLFTLAETLDGLPELVWFTNDSPHRLPIAHPGHSQWFHSGRGLAEQFAAIVGEFAAAYDVPRSVVVRLGATLVQPFLHTHGAAPAAVHGYMVSWRDITVVGRWGLSFGKVGIADDYFSKDGVVDMGFITGRTPVSVDLESLCDLWLTPGDARPQLFRRRTEKRWTLDRVGGCTGYSIRRDLFPVTEAAPVPYAPALFDRTHALWLVGGRPIIAPRGIALDGGELLAVDGILDVVLLNAWRIYHDDQQNRKNERVDELALAIDRTTKRLAYIATLNSELYFNLHNTVHDFAGSRLGLYLGAKSRNPRGHAWHVGDDRLPQ